MRIWEAIKASFIPRDMGEAPAGATVGVMIGASANRSVTGLGVGAALGAVDRDTAIVADNEKLLSMMNLEAINAERRQIGQRVITPLEAVNAAVSFSGNNDELVRFLIAFTPADPPVRKSAHPPGVPHDVQ